MYACTLSRLLAPHAQSSAPASAQSRRAIGERRPSSQPLQRQLVVARGKKKSKKDVQMSEAAWFLDQFKYQQRYKAQTNVFSMPTKELPGGEKLTAEGVAVGVLVGFIALWFGSVSIKLVSITWALIFTTLKYAAIAGVLVFLGIVAS